MIAGFNIAGMMGAVAGGGSFASGVVDLTGKAEQVFTNLSHTTMQLAFDNVPSNSVVQLSSDNGATWLTDYYVGALNHSSGGAADQTYICELGYDNPASYGIIKFRGFNDADVNTITHGIGKGTTGGNMRWSMGRDKTIRAHNAIRIIPTSGTFASGKVSLRSWTDERIILHDFVTNPVTAIVIPTSGVGGAFTDMDYIVGAVGGNVSVEGRLRVSTTGAAPFDSGGSDYVYARYSAGSDAAGSTNCVLLRDKKSSNVAGSLYGVQDTTARTTSDAQIFGPDSNRVYSGTRLNPQADTALELSNDDGSSMAVGVVAFYGGYEYEKIGNYQGVSTITENSLDDYSDLIVLSDNRTGLKVELSADGGASYETSYQQGVLGHNWNNSYTATSLFRVATMVDWVFTVANFNQAGIPTIGQGTSWKGGVVNTEIGKVDNNNAHNAIKITAGGSMPNVTIYGRKG